MAFEDIKDKGFDSRTTEELQQITRKGGINSGIARREKATMKKTLEMMLDSKYKKTNVTYRDKVTLGLLANAIDKTKGGNPEAYKTIMAVLGELNQQSDESQINNNITNIATLINNPVDNRNEDNIDE